MEHLSRLKDIRIRDLMSRLREAGIPVSDDLTMTSACGMDPAVRPEFESSSSSDDDENEESNEHDNRATNDSS